MIFQRVLFLLGCDIARLVQWSRSLRSLPSRHLTMKEVQSFETLGTGYLLTQCHVLEEWFL